MSTYGAVPVGAAAWGSALSMLAGVLVGMVRFPLSILAGGPVGRLVRAYGAASQESAFNAAAVGDGVDSVGILQFNVHNDIMEKPLRFSAFWSGYYSCAEVQRAMGHSWRWLSLCIPFAGFAFERYLWTHGPSDASARNAWTGDTKGITAFSQAAAESRAWCAFVAGQVAVVLPLVAAFAWFRRGK